MCVGRVTWLIMAMEVEFEGQRGTEKDMEESGRGKRYERWCEQGDEFVSIKVDCWCQSNLPQVESTLTYRGYHRYNIIIMI